MRTVRESTVGGIGARWNSGISQIGELSSKASVVVFSLGLDSLDVVYDLPDFIVFS